MLSATDWMLNLGDTSDPLRAGPNVVVEQAQLGAFAKVDGDEVCSGEQQDHDGAGPAVVSLSTKTDGWQAQGDHDQRGTGVRVPQRS